MVYLDNAATTFPKPETVYDTVDRFQRNYAVNAGRGMYKTARIASDMIGETRKLMADLTKCKDENRVIFSPSATIAMNQVLCGMNLKNLDSALRLFRLTGLHRHLTLMP